MQFEDFIKAGQVKRGASDRQLAKALQSTAEQDMKFLNALPITALSARKMVSNYYDVLRSMLEAVVALEGLKVYSHEAFLYYLLERDEESLGRKFDRLRRIRNGINYYGKDISVAEAREVIAEMKKLIEYVQSKLQKELRHP